MATLHEYFETDFSSAVRINVTLKAPDSTTLEAALLCDFTGFYSFFACYVPGYDRQFDFFVQLLEGLKYGATNLPLNGSIVLPMGKLFPGQLEVSNADPFDLRASFHGDSTWKSYKDINASRRVFIYSETALTEPEVHALYRKAKENGHDLQFRSRSYLKVRQAQEVALAFISHDSRDKDIARQIATGMQSIHCPVWYDEFSLKVGDNLRESIEDGLKKCRKCILLLSPNFLSNQGWTKREFDSIFTREILEKSRLVLPVWLNVRSKDVFEYSPSLANIKGLNWLADGQERVITLLARAVSDEIS